MEKITITYNDKPKNIKYRLINWDGVIIRIDKKDILQHQNDRVLNRAGIYILIGERDDGINVYVGQADMRSNGKGIFIRVSEHLKNEDYWDYMYAFTTNADSVDDEGLQLGDLSYLENKFYNLIAAHPKYICRNGNEPRARVKHNNHPMYNYLLKARFVLNAVGVDLLNGQTVTNPNSQAQLAQQSKNIFEIKNEKLDIDAWGYLIESSREFVLCQGSKIRAHTVNSFPDENMRIKMIEDNWIDENYVLTQDVIFSSPSRAASMVKGSSVNGNSAWKLRGQQRFLGEIY
ncbi:GIY-YIG nuclease family protein [Ligilactobacillus ceti]|uniref:DUF4357 domain-containing protein n=1 Tax=Ligilactobacillus ceti DSM 22408 TaxID=1122146 RepID=A0A0R2KMB8_9LACO|nr:GIY-YIG nuclease family protein [Ligilactobacillus ceti]KRN88597.1 hypothetical protein IV53_GL000562 [Ligilactobacillus ceti DSM 22408]